MSKFIDRVIKDVGEYLQGWQSIISSCRGRTWRGENKDKIPTLITIKKKGSDFIISRTCYDDTIMC